MSQQKQYLKCNVQIDKSLAEIKTCLIKNITNPKCVHALFDTIEKITERDNSLILQNRVDELEAHYEKFPPSPELYEIVTLAELETARFMNELKRRFIRDTTRFMSFWFKYVKEVEKVKPFARVMMLDHNMINWQSFFSDIYNVYNNGFTFAEGDKTLNEKFIKYMNIVINAVVMSSRRNLGIDNNGRYKVGLEPAEE